MSLYLDRYAWPHSILGDPPAFREAGIITVIPSFKESDITRALQALDQCTRPQKDVLVLIVINEPENASAQIRQVNERTLSAIRQFRPSWFRLASAYVTFPVKKAGVGLARKVGMDEAVRIFEASGKNGIIASFDADCHCDPNYFREIEAYFSIPRNNLGLIHFAHDTTGSNSAAIVHYELFLRYYIDALRYSGYPFAFQTLGSCMAMRSSAYQKQGGMNSRKAGEDFYFIHKMMPLGGVGEIVSTRVYPSDRISDRVPFGTGHAIEKLLTGKQHYQAYHPESFNALRIAFARHDDLFTHRKKEDPLIPDCIRSFYSNTGFAHDLKKILEQSNTLANFSRKFFSWWDGFRVLKFLHYSRDHFHPDIPLIQGLDWLNDVYFGLPKDLDPLDLLLRIREFDAQNTAYIR